MIPANFNLIDFKKYWARENGANWQPSPLYDSDAEYNTDDMVVGQDDFTYKWGQYKSIIDENIGSALSDEDAWEKTDLDLDDYVLDSQINRAIDEANPFYNEDLWNIDTGLIAFYYIVMHFISYDLANSENGLYGDSEGGGIVTGRKAGDMSVSYAVNPLVEQDPNYNFWAKTGYGEKYYQMLKPRLCGNMITSPSAGINF